MTLHLLHVTKLPTTLNFETCFLTDRPTNEPTNRLADIVKYRAAIAAKKGNQSLIINARNTNNKICKKQTEQIY